jgi:hypothetical protein
VQKTAAAGKVCQRSKSVSAKTKKKKQKQKKRNSDHLSQFSMSFH